MLARIAAVTEARRPRSSLSDLLDACSHAPASNSTEAIASVVEHALETVPCGAVFVPTRSGTTARMISRFKPRVWIGAASRDRGVCQSLAFSYGVQPVEIAEYPEDWNRFCADWLRVNEVDGRMAILVAGPSEKHPNGNHRIEFARLD
jgi:pyruvate kinase